MKYSIVVPVYNAAKYLRECLDSILRQTSESWEAICIDDGSTDGSGAILDAYAAKDSRFVIVHQRNRGSSAARNEGVLRASGEWIWFVDADDYIEPDALTVLDSISPKAEINYFSLRLVFGDGLSESRHLKDTGLIDTHDGVNELIRLLSRGSLGDTFGWTVAKIINRDLIRRNRIRFDESISFYEDEVFTIRLVECARSILTMSNVLYSYRIVNNGLTARGIPDPVALARAFLAAGAASSYGSIWELVDSRVTSMLRDNIHRKHSYVAAKLLLADKQLFSGRIELLGLYNKVLKFMLKLPVPIAAASMVILHYFRR